MRDPLLTPYGEEQCRDLASKFPYHDNVDLVVASPLKRTIYTALHGFGDDIQTKDIKVIALPELQETSDLPCDTGSSPEDIAAEFDGKPIDLTLVQPDWNSKKSRWAPTAPEIEKRARDARVWLMARPEKEIVVVTHGGFLHYFTEDWTGSEKFTGTGWANTEFRSYTFSSHEPSEAHLIETPESRKRRSGDLKPLDHNEQTQLKETATKEWEKSGYVSAQTPAL
nr:putative phosphatase spac5h10.03 [Quercus suber]